MSGRSVRLVVPARAVRRLVRHGGRRLITPVLAVALLAFVRGVAGTVAAAVVGGIALSASVLWWWLRVVEPRLFATRTTRPSAQLVRPATQSHASSSEAERHLMFARALSHVAVRYLAECEQEVEWDREVRR